MKEATLKDLFLEKGSYIIDIPINNKFHLFIEGLSENRCSIIDDFDIGNIKALCVELIEDGECLVAIDDRGFSLGTPLEAIKRMGRNLQSIFE